MKKKTNFAHPVQHHAACTILDCDICLKDLLELEMYVNNVIHDDDVDSFNEYKTWLIEHNKQEELFNMKNINKFVKEFNKRRTV